MRLRRDGDLKGLRILRLWGPSGSAVCHLKPTYYPIISALLLETGDHRESYRRRTNQRAFGYGVRLNEKGAARRPPPVCTKNPRRPVRDEPWAGAARVPRSSLGYLSLQPWPAEEAPETAARVGQSPFTRKH
jgi:hypothetical protein